MRFVVLCFETKVVILFYMQFVEMQGVSNTPPSKPHIQGEQSGQSRQRKRSISEPPEKTNKIFIGKLTSSSDKDEIEKVGVSLI